MPSPRTLLGNRGEQMAADYLEAQGLQILARNFRARYGEVGLVASDGDAVVFVEVKTRRSGAYGLPLRRSSTFRSRGWRTALGGWTWCPSPLGGVEEPSV